MSVENVPVGFKRCTKCGEVKEIGEFGRHKKGRDGLHPHCKRCNNKATRRWRQENPEKAREIEHRWQQKNPEKAREKNNRWQQENPEKKRESERRWAQENPEKRREAARRWQQKNPEKAREKNNRWQQENPEKAREATHRRRARKRQLPTACPANIEAILFDLQDGQCMYCGCDLLDGYHVDHILPLALVDLLGDQHPGHVPSNLCLACGHCNKSKNATVLEDWLQWKYPDQMDEILLRVEQHVQMMRQWEEDCR